MTAFYHYIISIHIKKAYKNQFERRKKNHVPQAGIEPGNLQISQKQGNVDLNAITRDANSPTGNDPRGIGE